MGKNLKKILIILSLLIILLVAVTGGAIADRVFGFRPLDKIFPRQNSFRVSQTILTEESVVTAVAENVSPSVVTVSYETPQRKVLQFDPFGGGFSQKVEGGTPEDIGSGFVVSKDGLIITNKHVVSAEGKYKVITNDNKEYEVKEISKDPSNDIAVLKIEVNDLTPIELGDSANLKVGQFVIAIGTALGEFRHTVTTGVVSGLGRGITTGGTFSGYVEKLDDVIQTDAAINPGNSGGPLLNSAGQVIGINVAIAQGAQNIGFAIPINTVKEALEEYQVNGKFSPKPYLGVEYQMVEKQTAILNNVPQGAYVVGVVTGSPAEKAGILEGDIITKIADQTLSEDNKDISLIVSSKKVGEKITVEVWRDDEIKKIEVILEGAQE